MTYLVGKIALDILAGAPNNGRGENNVAMVKQMWINGKVHPYVSAQAFRRWLRDSLPADEPRSGVTRSGTGKNQQAYTEGRPDRYLDDDLFGYMVAVSKANYQRDTVLATGTFVAVTPQRPTRDFGTMSRGFNAGENPVLHEHEHYSADLAGDVLLDLPR
ncbi:MAG: type I-B CRISPR-associated protein Cas7/Cst2/DevR, partial [Pseudonocardiaceae bacterium]